MNEINPDSFSNQTKPAIWVRPPAKMPARRVLALIHGWTGDEHSMTIFANKLPGDFWLYSPRGPVKAPKSGYGWLDASGDQIETYTDYQAAASALFARLMDWIELNNLSNLPLGLAGFSQGAAVAYTLALENPGYFDRVAGLAGYLPPSAEQVHSGSSKMQGKQFFIAHGTRDETVPVRRARSAVQFFESAGARVNYCEDNSAHKLSLSCFQAMGSFFDAP